MHQPQYLPWLGYFDKIRQSDFFCYLDTVQYKKNEWQNRNRIKTAGGWQWLTVPVKYSFGQKINRVPINNDVNWPRKHLQALRTNYTRSAYFSRYADQFEQVYDQEWALINDLNIHLVDLIRQILGLGDKPVLRASEMVLRDEPNDRLIDICRTLGADTYLAGAGGANYMDLDRFKQGGIKVIFQKFEHPVYPQVFGAFQANMSIVDLLFNCGPDSPGIIAGAKTK